MERNKASENCTREEHAPRPECFGNGERVCPEDEDGIMQPQKECLPCSHLRECVQTALVRRGKLRIVEPPSTKVSGFLKRWSDNKLAGK
jgi:hypothetical protein